MKAPFIAQTVGMPDMSEAARDAVAGYLRLLGEPFRLRLLQLLAEGPLHVQALVERTGSSHANVSKHLRLLHEGGLLRRHKSGLTVTYAIGDALVPVLCQAVMTRQLDLLGARTTSLADAAAVSPQLMGSAPASMLSTHLSLAIAAHAAWKTRLRHAIELRTSEIDPQTATRDDRCELGQWLHDGIAAADRGSPHYTGVLAIHAALHREVGHVVQMAIDGDQADARAALGTGSPFSQRSAELVQALLAWQADA